MWVLLPLKSFAEAKQRLGGCLSPGERAALARAMAEDVLHMLGQCAHLERIVVVSRDPEAEALARIHSVDFMIEPPLDRSGLNPVVGRSVELLCGEGADNVMVVHGDLPLLGADELQQLIDLHRAGGRSAVTLTPDRAQDGTNVLAWSPAAEFRPLYGPSSFERHREQARRAGATLAICESAGGGLDIDLPADLLQLLTDSYPGRARATRRYLRESHIAHRMETEWSPA